MDIEKRNTLQRQIRAIKARLLSGKVKNPYPLINKLNTLIIKLRREQNKRNWNNYLSQ